MRLLPELPGIIVHAIASVVILVPIASSSSSILRVEGKWVYVLFYPLAHLGEPTLILWLKTVHVYTNLLSNAAQVSLIALYVTNWCPGIGNRLWRYHSPRGRWRLPKLQPLASH